MPQKKPARVTGYPKFDKIPVRYGRGMNTLVAPRRLPEFRGPITEADLTKGVLAHLHCIDSDVWTYVGTLPRVPGIVEHAFGAACQVALAYDYGFSYFEDTDMGGRPVYTVVMPPHVARFSKAVEDVKDALSAWLAGVEACVRKPDDALVPLSEQPTLNRRRRG